MILETNVKTGSLKPRRYPSCGWLLCLISAHTDKNSGTAVIRTGEDPDHVTPLLQVMPWPTFRKMNDHDLRAIYEYLSAIPSIERKDGVPGPCHGPDLDF